MERILDRWCLCNRHRHLSKIGYYGLGNASCEGCFTNLLEQLIDFGRGASSMMNLRFHCSNFHDRLRYVIAEITDLRIVFDSFSTPSTFAATDLGLLFDEFLLFQPEVFSSSLVMGLSNREST